MAYKIKHFPSDFIALIHLQCISFFIVYIRLNRQSDGKTRLSRASPANKDLLIKLVEFFLPDKKIADLTLDDKVQHGLLLSSKSSSFDLYCTTDQGERGESRNLHLSTWRG